MQFQIPQFIEVEDKVIGPFTIKQFIYLAGGAGIVFVLWKALPFFIAVIFIIPVAALSLALAFYKVNDRSFIIFLESVFKYMISNKLYIWSKKEKKPKEKAKEEKKKLGGDLPIPKLSESKLKDIAWSLGVHESIYKEQEKK